MFNRRKIEVAVGISDYDNSIIVKGQGISAEEIIKIAKEYKIPVIRKRRIARLLHQMDIDSEIPESLLKVIIIILRELSLY